MSLVTRRNSLFEKQLVVWCCVGKYQIKCGRCDSCSEWWLADCTSYEDDSC